MDIRDPSIVRVESWALFEHKADRSVHLVGTKEGVAFRSSPIVACVMEEGVVRTASGKIYALGQPSLTRAHRSLACLSHADYPLEPLPLEAFLTRVRIKNAPHAAPAQAPVGGGFADRVARLRDPAQAGGPGAGIAAIMRNAMQGRAL